MVEAEGKGRYPLPHLSLHGGPEMASFSISSCLLLSFMEQIHLNLQNLAEVL